MAGHALRNRAWWWRPSWLSWLGTVFVATMDEWHQSYIPSRTGSIWDVVLDSAAGAAFLVAAYFWLRREVFESLKLSNLGKAVQWDIC